MYCEDFIVFQKKVNEIIKVAFDVGIKKVSL